MLRIRFFITFFLLMFVSCQSVAGEIILYKVEHLDDIHKKSSNYESLKDAYEYFDYDGGLDDVLINKTHEFAIPSYNIQSAYVEDVWFKPEGDLIYQVALKLDSEILEKLNSYFKDTKLIALVINGQVFTTSYVEEPIEFVDNILIVSVIGRSKRKIREELQQVIEDVTIR